MYIAKLAIAARKLPDDYPIDRRRQARKERREVDERVESNRIKSTGGRMNEVLPPISVSSGALIASALHCVRASDMNELVVYHSVIPCIIFILLVHFSHHLLIFKYDRHNLMCIHCI